MKFEIDGGSIFFSSDQALAKDEHSLEITVALLFYFASESDG